MEPSLVNVSFTGTRDICAIRLADGEECLRRSNDFPSLWKSFVHWYDGSILVGRDVRRACKALGTLFREHDMPLPDIKVVSYLDVLDIPEEFGGSYKNLAAFLNVEKPDEYDVEAKARFTVEVLRTFSESDLAPHVKTADFSPPIERQTKRKNLQVTCRCTQDSC